ncbi:MAG: 4-alpha-glucanotransferase [Candidatus Woesebacteria bacterium]
MKIYIDISTKKRLGTVAPLSSLHSVNDVVHDKGTLATGLYFLDWLHKTKQSLWQFLPLHTSEFEPHTQKQVSSPYKGYGIGLDPKYLPEKFASSFPTQEQKSAFISQHENWIHKYALFCALRDYFQTDNWREWDKEVCEHEPEAIEKWSRILAKEIDQHIIMQWRLHAAFEELKQKAARLGITLSGDLPFYLALHSPLVWAHQDAFEIEADGSLQVVSGVTDSPPSFFGRQVWGHPLYHWESKTGCQSVLFIWTLRLEYMASLFGSLRFDYAEAFYHYGRMDMRHPRHDQDVVGPGSPVFEKLMKLAGLLGISIFAEDSGTQTAEMKQSLQKFRCPSIRIFRFSATESMTQIPALSVIYTSTHDTETLCSFIENQTREEKQKIAQAAQIEYTVDDHLYIQKLIQAVISSPAQTVIVPIQDWLQTTERINIPGTETPTDDPNWRFQVRTPIEELPEVTR